MRPPDILTGDSVFLIEFREPSDVDDICKAKAKSIYKTISRGKTVDACTYKLDERERLRVVAPNPCDVQGETYAALLCHELGHVNEISLNLIPDHNNWKPEIAETVDWAANLPTAPTYASHIPTAPTLADYEAGIVRYEMAKSPKSEVLEEDAP